VATSLHWLLRRALPPTLRGRVRTLADLVLAPWLGSVRATRSTTHVSVTFDDGPDPEVTPALLDELDRHGASSTFFLLVAQCRKHPELAREIVRRGHEVALHGVDHTRLTTRSSADAEQYLREGRAELESIVGRPVRYYRPPYGAQSVRSYRATRRAGLTVVVWSGDAADWVDRPAAEVVTDGLHALGPGGILLMHERLEPDPGRGAPVTSFDRCTVVDGLLTGCRERGWTPATVGSRLDTDGGRLTAWFRP